MKILALFVLSSALVFGQASPNGIPNQTIGTASTNSATGQYMPGSYTSPGTGAVAKSPQSELAHYVNVEAFGALADGSTNNSSAITSAIAALNTGDTLYFPCTTGNVYRVTSPIDFGGMASKNIAGKGNGCQLSYFNSTTTNNYAFSFVGADQLNISGLSFEVDQSSANPPQTIMLLGRKTGNAASGHFNITNCKVEGLATKAVVYSITSEEDYWAGNILTLNGGGAKYVFFTSTKDELSVGSPLSATGTTNLSIWLVGGNRLQDFTAGTNATHAIVFDSSDGNGGDHVYASGYMSSPAGRGFQFNNNVTGPGAFTDFRTTIRDWRLENAGVFAYFSTVTGGGGDFLKDLRFYGNTLDSGAGVNFYSADASMGYQGLDLEENNAENGETSTLNNVNFSTINDNFSVTLTTVTNSMYVQPYGSKWDNYQASTFHSGVTTNTVASATVCNSSAAPAVCGSAIAGSVTVAAAATTKVVNSTAVTNNSQIILTFDSSLGARIGVTCNTTFASAWVSARTAATSFTITVSAAPTTNPACFSYEIIN